MFEHTIDVIEHSITHAENPGNRLIINTIEEMKKAIEVLKNHEE